MERAPVGRDLRWAAVPITPLKHPSSTPKTPLTLYTADLRQPDEIYAGLLYLKHPNDTRSKGGDFNVNKCLRRTCRLLPRDRRYKYGPGETQFQPTHVRVANQVRARCEVELFCAGHLRASYAYLRSSYAPLTRLLRVRVPPVCARGRNRNALLRGSEDACTLKCEPRLDPLLDAERTRRRQHELFRAGHTAAADLLRDSYAPLSRLFRASYAPLTRLLRPLTHRRR
eukprot:5298644-Pyramimonas_sp.AAC.1